MLRDLPDGLAAQGFPRIAIVNGHGGKAPVTGFLREWACQPRAERVQLLFHGWYNAPQTAPAADRFDRDQMHGGWVENFPWTRLPGVELPADARPDEDMQVVWDAGVAEVRAPLETGWDE